MDRLWAPWRVPYITRIGKASKKKSGIFARMAKEKNDRRNLIFVRSRCCFAVLNLYPYNNGHTLILPYREVSDPADLTPDEVLDFFGLMNDVKELLTEVLRPDGFNIGMNIGRVAGAGMPEHLHLHIVPRWSGDVNFMPVVSNTRVVSQSLKALYDALSKAHRRRRKKK